MTRWLRKVPPTARPTSTTRPGITRPLEQIDCAELYVPFSWYEPMWLEGHHIAEKGEGWKMVQRGDTALDGSFPVNMSGGVLSSNPIGASGLLRFAEARSRCGAWPASTRSRAPRSALGQAYGAAAQYFSMSIVANSLNPFN